MTEIKKKTKQTKKPKEDIKKHFVCVRERNFGMMSKTAPHSIRLTLDHDHVDIDGADLWLGQTLALLQQTRHIVRMHESVRLRPM